MYPTKIYTMITHSSIQGIDNKTNYTTLFSKKVTDSRGDKHKNR